MIDVFMSKKDVARYLKIDPRTVDNLIDDKKVIAVDIQKITRYILVVDIFRYLSE
jgi:plasmid maintenance system antidote protein VapI